MFIMIYHTNAFSENAFSYDLNLTSRVSSGDTTLAVYGHLADGTKIRSVDGTGNGLQYRGSLVYTQTAGQSGSPILTLDCALTSAGRIVRWTAADGSVSYRSLIHLRDHLGSVRAVIDGDTGTVLEANDYYPFGKRIPTVTEALSVTEPVEAPPREILSGRVLVYWAVSGHWACQSADSAINYQQVCEKKRPTVRSAAMRARLLCFLQNTFSGNGSW